MKEEEQFINETVKYLLTDFTQNAKLWLWALQRDAAEAAFRSWVVKGRMNRTPLAVSTMLPSSGTELHLKGRTKNPTFVREQEIFT